MSRARRTLLPLLLVALPACSDGTGPGSEPTRVVIAASQTTLDALGDTLQLQAEVLNRSGEPLPDARVEWSTPDSVVVTVDSLGRVVAREVGTARVVAASGNAADTVEITVAGGVAETELKFVEFSASAPPLVTRDTSFWAVRGQDRELEIDVAGSGDDGDEFLEFEVDARSLLRYPDGRLFEEGDSVLIRVQVDESGRFLIRFEPSGLRFDPERPAELRVRYRHAEQGDLAEEQSFYVWRQEEPGDLWVKIATLRLEDLDEVRAELTGFTAFSLAIP